ncbi:MAG: tetratricopeptide repeat protein [Deltaproteobacteria bacterium]|nr:tetratricopeptide repeat protein [Deltaproteobacteria bacterium]
MKRLCAVILLCLGLLALAGCTDPARERFEAAEKALLEQKMETALSGYRSIPKEYPQSRHAPTALLRQGELFGTYYRNYPAALEAYESLVFNYPRASEAPQALLRRGEIHLLHFLDHAAAAEELEMIRKLHPRFGRMDEVLLLLAKAYEGASDRPREFAALSELVEKFPESSRAAEGRWMLAFALLAEGKFLEADREFRKLSYLATDRRGIARARWGMAQSLEGLGRLSEAVEQYEAIRNDWEDPSYVAEKIDRLKRRMKVR